jgi:hypothetical protein
MYIRKLNAGSNLTIVSYNASVVKFYNTSSWKVCLEKNGFFVYFVIMD